MNYMEFRQKLATDADFKAKFSNCETVEELIKAAAGEGYSFTADDIRNNTEVLPEELAMVAGGLSLASAFSSESSIAADIWN